MGEVVKFPNQQPFQDFLDFLSKEYKENRLKDFICITCVGYREDEEVPEGMQSKIYKYWFGDKCCLYLLGLCDVMKDCIIDYMKEVGS